MRQGSINSSVTHRRKDKTFNCTVLLTVRIDTTSVKSSYVRKFLYVLPEVLYVLYKMTLCTCTLTVAKNLFTPPFARARRSDFFTRAVFGPGRNP